MNATSATESFSPAPSAAATEVISEAKLLERLEEKVWEAADHIGNPACWYRISSYSDVEMAAYADGVKNAITGMQEDWGLQWSNRLNFCHEQLDGALGERLRRLNSPNQKLKSRALTNLVTEIRDKRIAMIDAYDDLSYAEESRVWQKKIWAMDRRAVESDELCAELQRVKNELVALSSLQGWLWRDRHWVDRRMAKQRAAVFWALQPKRSGPLVLFPKPQPIPRNQNQ